jgi:cell division protein FtsZ
VGEERGADAARAAITSSLLETSIEGATGVLINVTGGADLTLHEVTEAANVISEVVDPSANIIFGAVIHPRYQKELRVTVIATGLRNGPAERGLRGVGAQQRGPGRERLGRRETLQLPYEDERPRREPVRRDDDRGFNRDDPRTSWRRRPGDSPDDDDDIDLPSFMRRRR